MSGFSANSSVGLAAAVFFDFCGVQHGAAPVGNGGCGDEYALLRQVCLHGLQHLLLPIARRCAARLWEWAGSRGPL